MKHTNKFLLSIILVLIFVFAISTQIFAEEGDDKIIHDPPRIAGESEFIYDGQSHTPEVLVDDGVFSKVDYASTDTETDAGTYQITYSLIDKDHNAWRSGDELSVDDVVLEWKINKAKVSIPSFVDGKNRFHYSSGETKSVSFEYDPEILEMSGDLSGEESGEYFVEFEIKYPGNYEWDREDNKIDPIVLE